MSTITFKNNTEYNENRKSLRERIADYFAKNHNGIVLGMYALSGTTPDAELLREMNIV